MYRIHLDWFNVICGTVNESVSMVCFEIHLNVFSISYSSTIEQRSNTSTFDSLANAKQVFLSVVATIMSSFPINRLE